jgi:hypothetical protein
MEWGPVIIVFVLVIGLPVATLIGGLVGAAGLGWLLKDDVDARYEGSELLETNR